MVWENSAAAWRGGALAGFRTTHRLRIALPSQKQGSRFGNLHRRSHVQLGKKLEARRLHSEEKELSSKRTFLPAIGGAFSLGWAHAAWANGLSNLSLLQGALGGGPLTEGFLSAFLLILFSEIGDKTFFIAVLLSLQNSQAPVFTGTLGALAIMTVISTALGQALHEMDDLLPSSATSFPVDDALAVALLIFFGIQTLRAAGRANDTAKEEEKEAQQVVSGLASGSNGLVLSTFALVFAAEWGDKSFLATAALSAASNPYSVCLGAIAGHAVATSIAVLGGSFLSDYVSERTIQYVGGSLFLGFAALTLYDLVGRIS